jgi:hypothetical protein
MRFIVVPLPPGKPPFAVQLNNNNNNPLKGLVLPLFSRARSAALEGRI